MNGLGFIATIGAVLMLALAVAPAAAQSPVVDGFLQDPVTGVVEPGYVVQGINYTLDNNTGNFAGFLFTAEDQDTFYFGFAQSVNINDNTYDINAIGWEDSKKGGHKLQELLGSDRAEVKLFDCDTNLISYFRMDYATAVDGTVRSLGVSGGDGEVFVGDEADVTVESSLGWNFNGAGPQYPARFDESPARVPTNTYDPGTSADPGAPWIYEIVYEWSVPRSIFPGGCIGGLQILEVHNSPLKAGAGNPEPVPILNISKIAVPPSGTQVMDGDTILFTILYENVGPVVMTDVTITDEMDLNLKDIVPLDSGVYDDVTRIITWPTIPIILPGESSFVRFQATVDPIESPATIFNFAVFSSPDIPTDVQTNTTEHDVIPTPDLVVFKECPADLIAGEESTYTITVTNEGFETMTGVVLVDDLPPEVIFVSAVPPPDSVVGQTVTFDLGSLDPDESVEVQITVSTEGVEGLTTNTATVSGDQDEDESNNTDECFVSILAADVTVTKTCDPATVVSNSTYSFVVDFGNEGTAAAQNVVLVDDVPSGFFQGDSFTAVSTIGTVSTLGLEVTVTIGTLAPGASGVLTISGQVSTASGAAGSYTNTAIVTTDSTQSDTSDDVDDCQVAVLAPDLDLTKNSTVIQLTTTVFNSASATSDEIVETTTAMTQDEVVRASRVVYTLTVFDTGNADATGVVLVDTLPAGVTVVANPDGGVITGNVVTWIIPVVPAGSNVSVTLTVETLTL